MVFTAVCHYILCPCEIPRDSRETTRFAAGYVVTPPSYAKRERAHFSRAVAVLPLTLANSTTQAGNSGFLCILHKNKRQKLRNFVHILVKLWFFGFQPQYVVDFDPFHPTKSPTSCGFTQFAFGSKWCYTVLAQSKTAPQHQPAVRRVHPPALLVCTLPSKQRPVKAAHLHSKRTAPLTAGGSSKPAQHSAHTTASTIASAFQSRRWRTRAKLKGRYWCTLKSKHRTARIQLHHRVTVVLPAPAV